MNKILLITAILSILLSYNIMAVCNEWTEQTGSGNRLWYDIASSDDGQHLIASTGIFSAGYIYTSSNYGVDWTERTSAGNRIWYGVASDDTGQHLVALDYYGYIYTSDNYGVDWTERTSAGIYGWYDVASDDTGQNLIISTYSNNYLYISNDYGVTWNASTSTGLGRWRGVAINSSGNYLIANNEYYNIYISDDNGLTWDLHNIGTILWGLASSSSGQYIVSSQRLYANKIFISDNYGMNWTERLNYTIDYTIRSIDISDNGQYIIFVTEGGYAYLSDDYGITWHEQIMPSIYTRFGASISDDGNKIFILDYNGYIWSYDNCIITTNLSIEFITPPTPLDNELLNDTRNFTVEAYAEYDTILLKNVTISLYNESNDFINMLLCEDINVTSIDCLGEFVNNPDGIYYYIATACDMENNCANTELRMLNISIIIIIPLCIDNHNICNNPIFNEGWFYCEILDTEYCAISCINEYDNITGYYGICDNGICVNNCSIMGYQECDSTTSFKICGNYDTDACLEYQSGFGCLSGQICSAGYCVLNNATGISNNHAFTVNPYTISTDEIVYSNNPLTRILTVNTFNYIHIQGFSINTNYDITYSSRTCKYSENNIYSDTAMQDINISLEKILTPLTETGYINISILPKDNINTTITLYDSLDNPIQNIILTRNSSEKKACIYNNDTLIYCHYSVNTFDDLASINIQLFYEFQSSTYTIKATFNRLQDYIIYTHPELFYSTDISKITINATDAEYKSIIINTVIQPQGFSATLRGDYNYLTCTYSQIGCYLARTYNNMLGGTDFTNYYDYTVCMQSFTNPNPSETSLTGDFLSGEGLTTGIKYLIILVVIMATFIGGYFTGLSIQEGKAGFIFGVVLSIFELLMFTIFGWIPVWITIMLGIITIGLSILIVIKSSSDSGA